MFVSFYHLNCQIRNFGGKTQCIIQGNSQKLWWQHWSLGKKWSIFSLADSFRFVVFHAVRLSVKQVTIVERTSFI